MGKKQTYLQVKIIYTVFAFFILFIGLNAIKRLNEKPDIPFEYKAGNNIIIITSEQYKGSNIVFINRSPVTSIFNLELNLDIKTIGDSVKIGLESNEKVDLIPTQLIPYYKDSPFIIISALAAFFFWLTALFVLLKKTELKEARILFWILMMFAIATITSPGKFNTYNDIMGFIIRISHGLSYVFGIACFLHFSIIFPKPGKRKRIYLSLLYSPVIIFCIILTLTIYLSLKLLTLMWVDRYSVLWDVVQIFLVVSIFAGTLYFYLRYRKTSVKEDKEKILWILWGNIVGVSPFILFRAIPDVLGLPFLIKEEYLLAFLLIIPVSFTFAVVKYHVFDIDIIIKRSLLYSILTLFVVVLYFGFAGITAIISQNIIGELDKVLTIIFVFLIVIILNPLRLRLNKFIDKIFFRVKYDFEKDISIFSSQIKEANTISDTLRIIITQIEKLIPVKSIAIGLRTGIGGGITIEAQKNFDEMSKNISEFSVFNTESDFLLPYAVKEKIEPGIEFNDTLPNVLNKMKINLVIPLVLKSELPIGAFILGDKLSGQRYNANDIMILQAIADQSVFAIDRIQLQSQLIAEELEKKNYEMLSSLKSEFVSSVSHELQTPLTSIRMFAETLSSGVIKDDNKRMEYLKVIEGESERLSRLISNILDFSKIEKGIEEYHFEEINLTALIKYVVHTLEYQLKKKNISLNTSFPDENVIICGDSDAISRAVLNILNNAIKFSYEGKSIEMSLNKDNSNAIIKVKDYGIGISEEDLPHLFEEFYRSKDMAAKSVSGTGLGLTITKHIIDAHKGQIIVNSTPGNGSEFIIKFPV